MSCPLGHVAVCTTKLNKLQLFIVCEPNVAQLACHFVWYMHDTAVPDGNPQQRELHMCCFSIELVLNCIADWDGRFRSRVDMGWRCCAMAVKPTEWLICCCLLAQTIVRCCSQYKSVRRFCSSIIKQSVRMQVNES